MERIFKDVVSRLTVIGVNFSVHHAEKSIYIKLSECGRIKQIRISDHEGHKTSRNCWEIRKDRTTQRSKKIFAFNDVEVMFDMLFAERLRGTSEPQ